VDYEYENPFEAERRRKKEEYQKEIRALTKELKGKSKRAEEEEERKKGEQEVEKEADAQNDLLRCGTSIYDFYGSGIVPSYQSFSKIGGYRYTVHDFAILVFLCQKKRIRVPPH
jgi:hypothetical protein